MRMKTVLTFIAITCIFILPVSAVHAEQDTTLSFSPIIIVDTPGSKVGASPLLMKPNSQENHLSAKDLEHQNKLSMDDLDKYSLALGATFHINDFLNIGAACGMPLTNEEPIQVEDLSIEAMVTMQF